MCIWCLKSFIVLWAWWQKKRKFLQALPTGSWLYQALHPSFSFCKFQIALDAIVFRQPTRQIPMSQVSFYISKFQTLNTSVFTSSAPQVLTSRLKFINHMLKTLINTEQNFRSSADCASARGEVLGVSMACNVISVLTQNQSPNIMHVLISY